MIAFVCCCSTVYAMVVSNEGPRPAKDWYNTLVDEENPYIMGRVKELGKKISLERNGVVDNNPRGWYLKFLHERVRGAIFSEAREARLARKKGETSTWKLSIAKLKSYFEILKSHEMNLEIIHLL